MNTLIQPSHAWKREHCERGESHGANDDFPRPVSKWICQQENNAGGLGIYQYISSLVKLSITRVKQRGGLLIVLQKKTRWSVICFAHVTVQGIVFFEKERESEVKRRQKRKFRAELFPQG